jgi:hypothetical protein
MDRHRVNTLDQEELVHGVHIGLVLSCGRGEEGREKCSQFCGLAGFEVGWE